MAASKRQLKCSNESVVSGTGGGPSTRSKAATRRGGKSILEDSKSTLTERTTTTKNERAEVFSAEAKAAMRSFAVQVVPAGTHTLRLKYAELKSFVPPDPSKVHFEQNQGKCRYKDIPCWDKTRIVLSWPPGVPNDFVHANRVTHELLENQSFICCQGPLESTVADFWRCVWQERARQIIMLCRTQEMGKEKCAQYWPSAVGDVMNHHGLVIKCEKVDSSDRSFVHTRLSLTYEKESRTVDHRQFITWPDKSVPKTPMAPFRLLQFTRKNPKAVTIIHCSAGVGRTGTLVVIELLYRSLTKAKIPDVSQLVKDVRAQRSHAVQTEDQYLYCHYAILQLLHVKHAASAHMIKHFAVEYEHYLKLLNDNGGKNLPMQATNLPQPCATCAKIVARANEPNSPSEKEKDSQKPEKSGREERGALLKKLKAKDKLPKKKEDKISEKKEEPKKEPESPPPDAPSPAPAPENAPHEILPVAATPPQESGTPPPANGPLVSTPPDAQLPPSQAAQTPSDGAPQNGDQKSKFQYKPAPTYTIQHAGGGKKAIVYHRNNNRPFVKAMASPDGVPQPQILVSNPPTENGAVGGQNKDTPT